MKKVIPASSILIVANVVLFMVLVTEVPQTRWTAQKIQELRRAHPKLEPYWPEPQAPDGGVKWSRRYR